MSSGAMIGIVVACLATLFVLIAALIVFLFCRRRLLARKPTSTRTRQQAVADVHALQQSGCGLPVDIPVEALVREPPPRYTSVDDRSTSSSHHHQQQHDLSASALPPPPPYSVQVGAHYPSPAPPQSGAHSQSGIRDASSTHTFPAAAASVWNSLPESVRASPSLHVFRSRLKTELFARSYSCSD